jgi:large subunit ribosomal protein L4
MSTVALYDASGEKKGSLELPEDVVAARVHEHAMWEAVKGYLANQRQGTHKTKTRHEVSGQKSKLFRQKGTGRARAGSATSGTRVGGGIIHGPRPRDYSYKVPVQVRRLALRSALTDRAANAAFVVIDDLHFEAPKTRQMVALFTKLGLEDRKVLVVSKEADRNLVLSCRNLPRAVVSNAGELNAYQVLKSDAVIFTRGGLEALREVLAG